SSQAAKDIATLIESIQVDTKEAVQAMENGTTEVESGTKFVDEAGAGLKEIMERVQNSSQLITEI
ncbi:MAG: methyl-accepting chemotaxis protein, partial [Nitrosopumilaceae archaeon]|nr:methyl-accepting chemotaxis protein [Nitrosopumilaceae archaeon]NIU86634.1 methyl-accepting chemotaxis protein [Nitrosopumilaceae archaeon]NIV65333.1 methyl-accepting chemotaxis protein [Nitrosopumilaceae archaeon]NIX60824.1 methyl-accepting chemotaxis protein [Nitrosopumilaceae archaeon]